MVGDVGPHVDYMAAKGKTKFSGGKQKNDPEDGKR